MSKANPIQPRRLDRYPAHDENLAPDRRAEPSPKVDPLELMESAARLHWRAAAWLLERTRPEEYGRKSASAAPRRQVEAALLHVLEAALEGTLPEQRDAVDGRVFAACQRAFASCFPAVAALSPLKPPVDAPSAVAILSPKTYEATESERREELNHDGTTSTTEDAAESDSRALNAAETFSAGTDGATGDIPSPADIVSPKIAEATEGPATEPPAILESPNETVPESQLLNLQRHAALRRRAALLSRKQQAATKRQKKAAKKRARAARKRAA
jgi:hypothetical protein